MALKGPPNFAPIANFPEARRAKVRAILTDIDDTLTEHGRLPAAAYTALEALHDAGLIVIPVTGRPAGWCDLIARQWPVSGVVGENGAFYFRYDEPSHRMIRRYAKTATQRASDRTRLNAVQTEVLREVKGCAVAADQAYREADLAIDFCEDVAPLPAEKVNDIVAVFTLHGATAKVSSIHVNGWFGGYDKLTTSLLILKDEFGFDAEAHEDEVVYVGDSPNDAPMFAYFSNSIGVANVMRFRDQLAAAPRWVTRHESARGFAELAERLLYHRVAVAT
jgi:HAD superfamily hydrolase (TIGR01484 family)